MKYNLDLYIDTLKNVSLFDNIDENMLSDFVSALNPFIKNYKKNDIIINFGDNANFIGIILTGTAQIFIDELNGNRNLIALFEPGNMFGETFSLSDAEEIPLNVQAQTECTVMFIDKNEITNPTNSYPQIHNILIQNLLQLITKKNLMLNRKLRYLQHKTTREKLMAFLNDQATRHKSMEFTIPYDRQALADFLGVERSAMSAEISKLQKDGLLITKKSYFKLL